MSHYRLAPLRRGRPCPLLFQPSGPIAYTARHRYPLLTSLHDIHPRGGLDHRPPPAAGAPSPHWLPDRGVREAFWGSDRKVSPERRSSDVSSAAMVSECDANVGGGIFGVRDIGDSALWHRRRSAIMRGLLQVDVRRRQPRV